MSSELKRPRSLLEIELAVEAEGREWMRQRLQEELQKEADLHGGVFPPQRPTRRKAFGSHLRSDPTALPPRTTPASASAIRLICAACASGLANKTEDHQDHAA